MNIWMQNAAANVQPSNLKKLTFFMLHNGSAHFMLTTQF